MPRKLSLTIRKDSSKKRKSTTGTGPEKKLKRSEEQLHLIANATSNIIRGTINQGDVRFEGLGRGVQCTANACLAVAHLSAVERGRWDASFIDNILEHGSVLYKLSEERRRDRTHVYLNVREVYKRFSTNVGHFCVENNEEDDISGLLTNTNEPDLPNLQQGLTDLFQREQYIIVICHGLSIAAIKEQNAYFVFDSHARNAKGLRTDDGTGVACIVPFDDLEEMVHHLTAVFGGGDQALLQYDACPIRISTVERPDETFLTLDILAGRNVVMSDVAMDVVDAQRRVLRSGRRKRRESTYKSAANFEDVTTHDMGSLIESCQFCGAKKFQNETMNCCSRGHVALLHAQNFPSPIKRLMEGTDDRSGAFIRNILTLNNKLAFATIGATLRDDIQFDASMYVISGVMYHRINEVNEKNNMFFYNAQQNNDVDMTEMEGRILRCEILEELAELLRSINPFAAVYKQLRDVYEEEKRLARANNETIPILGIAFENKVNRKTHNAPVNPAEIGVVFKSRAGEIPKQGKLRAYLRESGDRRNIRSMDFYARSELTDPLCFPLLFPRGELGFQSYMPREGAAARKNISMREYYVYRLQIRNDFNALLSAGKLTQQYVVSAFVRIEQQRLEFIRNHQKQLRCDTYAGLIDYVRRLEEGREERIGKMVLLPSSFVGSPRYMESNYQDCMAIVNKFGKPTLFITFTCNPRWPEIRNNLGSPNLAIYDRPDLTTRVFHAKFSEFLHEVIHGNIFGKTIAYVYVIEFQKRGLPHAHLLLHLDNADKPKTPDDIDAFISAELPDKHEYPELYDLVGTLMVHGPCGSSAPNAKCMKDGKCTKGFPKRFANATKFGTKGGLTYRRRDTGLQIIDGRRAVDNGMIVPYNGYLLLRYRAHINVEFVQHLRTCKYLFKYINKGADSAVYTLEGGETTYDELKAFIESRLISSCESTWRLFGYPVQGKSHTVTRMPVHLPGEKKVYFEEGEEEEAVQKYDERKSMLEAYFDLNRDDVNARRLRYLQIPEQYRFVAGKWTKRVRKSTKGAIPRMYTVSPVYREKFHLRILLLHVTGSISFKDLRTVNGEDCILFERAAQMRHLVTTDEEWISAMGEAADVQMPAQMRRFFTYLLLYCEVNDPLALWNRFKEDLCEDFVRRGRTATQAEKSAMFKINAILRHHDKNVVDFGLMTEAEYDLDTLEDREQTPDDGQEQTVELNAQQRIIYDSVVTTVEDANVRERWIFINGSAGTGKTYLYNAILTRLARNNRITVAVALTGIAALLLKGGRTAHSTFRIPLEINETTTSAIKINSPEGQRLKAVDLIVWDEVTMTHYMAIDVVDRLLRDLKQDNRPFGGTCVVLGGDLKQLLPVESDRTKQVEALFVHCKAWRFFVTHNLTVNMRTDADEQEFARWLVSLGRGDLNMGGNGLPPDSVEIPTRILTEDVIGDTYGNVTNIEYGCHDRSILCPTNLECDTINDRILALFPGDAKTALSVDSVVEEDARQDLQEEILNASTPGGMPHHRLNLKIGVPVILLRNISVVDGLVNGTRLIVKNLKDHILQAEIVTGQFAGRTVLLPRMDLQAFDENLLCTLRRRQFPVKLCFAMTINKSQGQTFNKVGIYLSVPVFSHGQLYVAFSRVRKWNDVRMQIKEGKTQGTTIFGQGRAITQNIVYKSIFRLINNIQH